MAGNGSAALEVNTLTKGEAFLPIIFILLSQEVHFACHTVTLLFAKALRACMQSRTTMLKVRFK